MLSIVRNTLAGIAGLAAGSAVNMLLIELNTKVLYPMPPGIQYRSMEEFGQYIATLPLPAFLVVFAAHYGQALVGGYIAARLSDGKPMVMAHIIGTLTLVGSVINNLMIPVPTWTWIEIPFYPVVAWFAGNAAKTVFKTKGNKDD